MDFGLWRFLQVRVIYFIVNIPSFENAKAFRSFLSSAKHIAGAFNSMSRALSVGHQALLRLSQNHCWPDDIASDFRGWWSVKTRRPPQMGRVDIVPRGQVEGIMNFFKCRDGIWSHGPTAIPVLSDGNITLGLKDSDRIRTDLPMTRMASMTLLAQFRK